MKSTDPKGADNGSDLAPGPETESAQLFRARDLVLGGLFGALGITVPMLFHAVGVGKVFMPMYLPILAVGLLVSWEVGLIVGCATPLLSAVLTGMPPLAPPIAVLMACELAVLAVTASLIRARGGGVWSAVVGAIVASHLVGVIALCTLGRLLGLDQGIWQYTVVSLLMSWPGVMLQLTVVPGAVHAIERASTLGPRYSGS